MSLSPSQLKIHGCSRWCIYHRLKDLGISCQCSPYRPLDVTVTTPLELLQIWSVTRQYSSPPELLKDWLKQCWQQEG
ncbi:Asr1405/Asl0597 family protein [Sodalinema gerasimenkoae]|uniref:Asr1405/Asl0597 family protein n=1 Tax=Sodalinema gerasimenkoae TaxID=2862348 RepID=UPI0013583068|nr:Asr1405/Asl0597 family protein [Sodalinema gerasimenkoae]